MTALEPTLFGADPYGTKVSTTAFQSALDVIGNRGGGILSIPPGEYKIDGPLTIPSNTSVVGSGIGNTILLDTSEECPTGVLYCPGVTNTRISDLSIHRVADLPSTLSLGFKGIFFDGLSSPCEDCLVERVEMQDVLSSNFFCHGDNRRLIWRQCRSIRAGAENWEGVAYNVNSHTTQSTDCQILDCYAESPWNSAVLCGGDGLVVAGMTIAKFGSHPDHDPEKGSGANAICICMSHGFELRDTRLIGGKLAKGGLPIIQIGDLVSTYRTKTSGLIKGVTARDWVVGAHDHCGAMSIEHCRGPVRVVDCTFANIHPLYDFSWAHPVILRVQSDPNIESHVVACGNVMDFGDGHPIEDVRHDGTPHPNSTIVLGPQYKHGWP